MTFDELQDNWQSQEKDLCINIDANLLLQEIKRNKLTFEATIFWRDFREVGVALPLFGFFLYEGIKYRDWTMILLAVLCLAVAVFMLTDRHLQKKKRSTSDESLNGCLSNSLAQVNHQIWLLKNILWWYLGPLGLGMLVFFIHAGIKLHGIGQPDWTAILKNLSSVFLLCTGIFFLNQYAVRKGLNPRKRELESLLNYLLNNPETTDAPFPDE